MCGMISRVNLVMPNRFFRRSSPSVYSRGQLDIDSIRDCHRSRTHLSLAKHAPEPRAMQPPELGPVIEIAEAGGLRHRYERRAV
jgi:hypothetical protein